MSTNITRGEILDIIGTFAVNNPDYRKALLADPKAVLSKQMGQSLPDSMKVKVVEETADTIYLIAPYAAPADGELSDADLEQVAGGKGKDGGGGDRNESSNTYICNDTAGVGTRVEITTNVG